jgi:hypothetical protein
MTMYYGLGARVLQSNIRARKPVVHAAPMRDHRTSKLRALPMSEIRSTALRSGGRSIARQTGSNDLGMSINGRGRAQTHGPQWYGSRRPDVVADHGTNRDRSAERL